MYAACPGIRSTTHKYTRHVEDGGEELYDVIRDPGEQQVLVNDTDSQGELDTHRGLLESYLAQTADPFLSMEWKADLRWRSHEGGYRAHRGPTAPMVE